MSKRLIEFGKLNFYPRSPCGERRKSTKLAGQKLVFLSTLSLRRATRGRHINQTRNKNFYPRSPCGERLPVFSWRCPLTYFYPRSPCGERRKACRTWTYERLISIHALLAESDVEKVPADVYYQAFLSTLSLRRATTTSTTLWLAVGDFYPRSPCGERQRHQ